MSFDPRFSKALVARQQAEQQRLVRLQQRMANVGNDRPRGGVKHRDVPSVRVILIADGAFDVLVGVALLAGTISSVTRPLGAGSLRPWPLFAAIGVGCLVFSAVLLAASTRENVEAWCRSIWLANMLTTAACVALLLAFPHLAHPYVVALAITGIGCAIFAILEWSPMTGQVYKAVGARTGETTSSPARS